MIELKWTEKQLVTQGIRVQIVVDVDKCKQYLRDTDWYHIRKIETKTAIPKDVLVKRKEARTALA